MLLNLLFLKTLVSLQKQFWGQIIQYHLYCSDEEILAQRG